MVVNIVNPSSGVMETGGFLELTDVPASLNREFQASETSLFPNRVDKCTHAHTRTAHTHMHTCTCACTCTRTCTHIHV